MRHRSPITVFFLSIITLGIYTLYWQVSTKNEMNRLGAQIPTAWLIVIPFVNIYWEWKYCQGVAKVTAGKLSTPLAFVLLYLLSIIGMAIIQSEFNSVGAASAAATAPVGEAPLQTAQAQPDNSFGGPVAPAPVPPAAPAPPAPDPQQPQPPAQTPPPVV